MRKTIFLLLIFSLPLWGGSGKDQLHAQNGKPFFTTFKATEYKAHNRNFDIQCDDEGSVYVANFEGLLFYDGLAWKTVHSPGVSRITCLHLSTTDSVMWMGGYNVLGYVEENDNGFLLTTWIVDDTDESQAFGEMQSIFEQHGQMYFTTSEGETYSFTTEGIKKVSGVAEVDQAKEWKGYNITAKADIPDLGYTALGTDNHGVLILDNHNDILYTLGTQDGLCSDAITALTYDGKGSVWGATDNGLFRVNVTPVYSHYGETDGLRGQVTCICAQSAQGARSREQGAGSRKQGAGSREQVAGGSLLVGTLQGLFVLGDDDRFTRVPGMDLACWQLVKTSEGVIAVTAEGICMYKDGALKQLTQRHTLCVIEEKTNTYLTGEVDAIYRYSLNGEDSLVGKIPNVIKFVKDKDGGIWAVTLNQRSYYMAPGSNQFVKRQNSKMNLLFEYTDSEGRLWKTKGQSGIISDALSERQKTWMEPLSELSVQAMEVDDDVAWIGGNFGIIRMRLDYANRMKPYDLEMYVYKVNVEDNNITFAMSDNKYDPIGTSLYSYRFGKDEEWSRWSEDQVVSLAKLSPGTYRLQARSRDAFGNIAVSDPFEVEIPTPLYAKWWMIVIYVIITIVGINAVVRMREQRLKRDQQRLQVAVDNATAELKEAQGQLIRQEREATVGKLTKGLIDRILNPMNYINNFSHLTLGLTKDLKEDIEDEEEHMGTDNYEDSLDIIDMMHTNLEKIEQHGLATTRILKAMEDLLKERSGRKETVNLTPLCQQSIDVFKKYYEKDIETYHVEVTLEKPEAPVAVDIVAELMTRVVTSMLSNALYAVKKKAEKGGGDYRPEIRVTLMPAEGAAPQRIKIRDNGIGIEKAIKDKVFDPFFTTKPTSEASGVGLYLGQQIVQDMHGTIDFTSQKDEYTEFTITLP